MPPDIPPPTTVITAVLLAWASGSMVFAAASRLWGEIQPGHFKVIWLVGAGLSLASGFGYRPAWILTAVSLAAFAAVYRGVDQWVGGFAAIVALVVLLTGVDLNVVPIAAAALLGAVSNAMLLGHWHLNQPRLGTRPILRLVYALWAAILLHIAATVVLGIGASNVAALAAWTAVVFTAFAAVLTAPVHHLVRTRSIMSATGILYLEILLCVVAAFTGTLGALARG
jgi:hypothetical protein